MISRLTAFACAALIAAGACSRSGGNAADTTLNTDLSLAAQQNQAQLDSLSAAERAPAPNALTANGSAVPATHSSSGEVATVHHRRSSGSSSGSSARSSGSSGSVTTTTTARAPTVVKHTKRDAAIGAGAGAVIGAVTSRNKVKGGLIGAAVGGILGGVIGNNVDKTKKP
jgi:hypothetical protein